MAIGGRALRLGIAAIDKNSITSKGLPDNYVTPTIADEETFSGVDAPFFRRLPQHAGLGLAAGAACVLPVRTHPDLVHRDPPAQLFVHRLHHAALNQAIADIGLVGHHDDKEPCILQCAHCADYARQQAEITQSPRRIGLAAADPATVDNSVAIEENRPRTYHFVAFIWSLGWETRQCHTTEWNASVCGVTSAGSTVGMTMTWSPTFFV